MTTASSPRVIVEREREKIMLSDRSERRWKAIKGIGFCSCWKTWKEKFQRFSNVGLMTSLNEGFPPVYYCVHSLVEHGISLYTFLTFCKRWCRSEIAQKVSCSSKLCSCPRANWLRKLLKIKNMKMFKSY